MLIVLGFSELLCVLIYMLNSLGRRKSNTKLIKNYLILEYFYTQCLYLTNWKTAMILWGGNAVAEPIIAFLEKFKHEWIILIIDFLILIFMIIAKPIIFRASRKDQFIGLKLTFIIICLPCYIIDFFFIMYYMTKQGDWWYLLYCVRFISFFGKYLIPSIFWDLILTFLTKMSKDHKSLMKSERISLRYSDNTGIKSHYFIKLTSSQTSRTKTKTSKKICEQIVKLIN